jgi:Ran GTPase-activating protein (RanGAP) involved in mRNA processing and transport
MIADKIANHAKYFPVLELNLSGNDSICGSRLLETFNPQPIFRLSESLRNTAAILKKLDLSWNDIGARAADHLMVTLQMNQLLETLVLKRSHVGALGAEQISSALPNMAGLRWLDISDCNLGSDGLMVFLYYNSSHNRNNIFVFYDAEYLSRTEYEHIFIGSRYI